MLTSMLLQLVPAACGKHGQRHGALHCRLGVPEPDVDLKARDHGAAKQKRHE